MKGRQSFLGGATILVISTLLVKVVGALYKIPLTNLLGGVGMGYYMSAYGIFNPIYAMSVAGFPIAVSKLIASGRSKSKNFNPISVLGTAFGVFSLIGLFMWGLLYFLATPFAFLVNNPDAVIAIRAIAPAILFAATGAAFRGYFEGGQNMLPTGISQGVEAVTKLIFGTVLAVMAMDAVQGQGIPALALFWQYIGIVVGDLRQSMPVVAAAGIFGVTIGSMSSLAFLSIYSLFSREKQGTEKGDSAFRIGKEIISLAIPVSMAALMTNIASVVDLVSIMSGLSSAVEKGEMILRNSYGNLIPLTILTEELPSFLYGSYTGLAMTIFNIVPAVAIAIGTAALPLISGLWAAKNRALLRRSCTTIIKLTGLFAIPAGIGISYMAEPILLFFFRHNPAEVAVASGLLRVLGLAVIFVAFVSPLSCILQGTGRVYLPAKLMAMGGGVKLIMNFLLVHIPAINIKAAPLSTLICYAIISLTALTVLNNHLQLNLNLVSMFFKPIVGSIFCGATARWVYLPLVSWFGNSVGLILSIGLGMMVYLLFILLGQGVTTEELRTLLGNHRVIDFLEKNRILK